MKTIKHHFRQKIFSLFLFLVSFTASWAQIPFGYYDNAEGKSERELKTALHNITRNGHIELDFNANNARFWWDNYFRRTDWHPPTTSHPNGFFWCMYSTDSLTIYIDGNHQNREHAMPRSWWSIGTSPNIDYGFANGDLHNLFPANQTANAAKSNFPLGVVANITFNNSVVRVGRSAINIPGYSGSVFEPPNEYKGDFARTYLYMVTRYENYAHRWRSIGTSTMLQNNTYPTLTTYAINLLLEWHRADPVSDKERNRNDSVYQIQRNRNPFIDHPELAEHIWGNRVGTAWFRNSTIAEFGINYLSSNVIEVSVSRRGNEAVRYEIYSVTGLRLLSGTLPGNNTLTLNDLNNGMYILVVYAGNQRYTARILVGRR